MKKNLNKYNSKKSQSQPFSAKKLQSIKNPYRVAQNPLQSDLIETITTQCIVLEESLRVLNSNIANNYTSISPDEVNEKIDRLLGFATNNDITSLFNEAYVSLSSHHEKLKDGTPDNVIHISSHLSIV